MDSNSDADFEVAAIALFCFRGLEDLVYIRKKENIGYKQWYFRTSATASSSSMLHLFAFQLLLFRVLPLVTQIRFFTEICRASDAALA